MKCELHSLAVSPHIFAVFPSPEVFIIPQPMVTLISSEQALELLCHLQSLSVSMACPCLPQSCLLGTFSGAHS